jgi:outer membrane protein assembly factor BamA
LSNVCKALKRRGFGGFSQSGAWLAEPANLSDLFFKTDGAAFVRWVLRVRVANQATVLGVGILSVFLSACAARSRSSQLYPELQKFTGREVGNVNFLGAAPFKSDTLLTVVETQPTHCSLLGVPICVPFTSVGRHVHRFSLPQVHEDVVRLQTFFRYSGYFGTRVAPSVAEDGDQVEVTFTIQRGDSIMLDSLIVLGTDTVFDADSVAATLPLRVGDIFHLGRFDGSAKKLLEVLQERGHVYAQVLRNFSVDTIRDRATAALEVIPGPRVTVDSIAIFGADNLGRTATLRQLAFGKGDVLRASTLIESQRNLYSLDLVQLASVGLAPDSLDATPTDSSRATVIVRIAEARVNQVDAVLGYGTVECLRTETQYLNRSFTGGARRLATNASLSKIGLGGATQTGIGESLCRAFASDTFGNTLDYRLSADFTQPFFISPRNHISLHGFVERVSEASAFQRQAQGGRILVTRRLAPRALLTGGFDIEHGSTVASNALFCTAFEVCEPETIERLTRPRWRNSVGINLSRDRTDYALDPTDGTTMRAGLAWAPPWLLSDVTFLRGSIEGAVYREIRPGWVLASSVRLGNFFRTATLSPTGDFLPPEERFFSGGANTVRGFTRNQLGNGVYVSRQVIIHDSTGLLIPIEDKDVRFVPVGGTAMGVANLELRFPSPLFRQRVRLVGFIDAGAIGGGNIWDLDGDEWRITPGAGIRIGTPVGPVRIDGAFNAYNKPEGPLFQSNGVTLVRLRDDFRPAPPTFFDRFRIHVAVGQAF